MSGAGDKEASKRKTTPEVPELDDEDSRGMQIDEKLEEELLGDEPGPSTADMDDFDNAPEEDEMMDTQMEKEQSSSEENSRDTESSKERSDAKDEQDDEEDSDDDAPLVKKKVNLREDEEDSDDDDVPLVKKKIVLREPKLEYYTDDAITRRLMAEQDDDDKEDSDDAKKSRRRRQEDEEEEELLQTDGPQSKVLRLVRDRLSKEEDQPSTSSGGRRHLRPRKEAQQPTVATASTQPPKKKKKDIYKLIQVLRPHRDRTIDVGNAYQAELPSYTKSITPKAREAIEDRDELIWKMPNGRSSLRVPAIDKYIKQVKAHNRFFDEDWALYILCKRKYDYEKAFDDVQRRSYTKTEWPEEDHVLFRLAISAFGKRFPKIKTALPEYSMAALVYHYYHTKHRNNYKFLMRRKIADPIDSSDSEEEEVEGRCENCYADVNKLYAVDEIEVCKSCRYHVLLTGTTRKVDVPPPKKRAVKKVETAYWDLDDFDEFMPRFGEFTEYVPESEKPKRPPNREDEHFVQCGFEPYETKCHVLYAELKEDTDRMKARNLRLHSEIESNMKTLDAKMAKCKEMLQQMEKEDKKKPPATISEKWTQEDKKAADICFERYGKDFEAVAEILETKTAAMVESYYGRNKRAIDSVIARGSAAIEQQEEQISFDDVYNHVFPPQEIECLQIDDD